MRVQTWLRAGNTLAQLQAELGIVHARHQQYPHLVQLTYDQIESPTYHPIVQECRGVILDESRDWTCVARPFDRFYNLGMEHAAEIDWNTARVQTKCDGSLLVMYGYDTRIHVATRGRPDASGSVGGFFPGTFADLFWKTWSLPLPSDLVTHEGRPLTLMFELMTPYNRIVVPYTEPTITLLAVRFSDTGEERHPADFGTKFHFLPWVIEHMFYTVEDMLAALETMDGAESEGFVIVDGQFRRIKAKAPSYVALHHLKGAASPKNFAEVVRSGEGLEMLSVFPDLAAEFEQIQAKFDAVVRLAEDQFAQYREIPVQKDFALQVKELPTAPILFALRSGKAGSVRDYLRHCSIYTVLRLLELD